MRYIGLYLGKGRDSAQIDTVQCGAFARSGVAAYYYDFLIAYFVEIAGGALRPNRFYEPGLVDRFFVGQRGEGYVELHVDVYRAAAAAEGGVEGVAYFKVGLGEEGGIGIGRHGNIDPFPHYGGQGARLPHGLAVELIDPAGRAVGGDGYHRHAAVVCLGQSWAVIHQRRPRCAYQDYGLSRGQRHAESHEGGATLVDDSVYAEVRRTAENHRQRRRARARRHYDIAHAVIRCQRAEHAADIVVDCFYLSHKVGENNFST